MFPVLAPASPAAQVPGPASPVAPISAPVARISAPVAPIQAPAAPVPATASPVAHSVASLSQVLSAFAFTLENAATENYYSNQSDIPTDSGKTGKHKCIVFIQGWTMRSALIG